MSGAPQRPRVREEFLAEFMHLGKCIDNLLAGHHGLRHSLDAVKRVAVPFTVSEVTAMEAFGVGSPLFHLWNECRLVEALRVAWTGEASEPVPKEAPP
jgi:hypothetical protein